MGPTVPKGKIGVRLENGKLLGTMPNAGAHVVHVDEKFKKVDPDEERGAHIEVRYVENPHHPKAGFVEHTVLRLKQTAFREKGRCDDALVMKGTDVAKALAVLQDVPGFRAVIDLEKTMHEVRSVRRQENFKASGQTPAAPKKSAPPAKAPAKSDEDEGDDESDDGSGEE